MIQIYDSKNKNYDYNGDMILKPSKCVVTRKLQIDNQNLVYELELVHNIDKEGRSRYIKGEDVIRAPTPSGTQLFRILNIEKNSKTITAYAKHIFFDTEDNIIKASTKNDYTDEGLKNALDKALEGTDFKHNITTGYFNSDCELMSTKKMLLDTDYDDNIADIYEIDIDNFNINLYKKNDYGIGIGSDNGCRADFGYDLKDIKEIVDYSNMCTRIIASTYDDGDVLNYVSVDSKNINNYSKIYEKNIEFKYNYTDPNDWLDINKDLRHDANLYFKKNKVDVPTVNYTIDLSNLRKTTLFKKYKQLDNLQIGDIVHCRNVKHNITTDSRLISYEYDSISKKYTLQELGDYIPNFLQLMSKGR
ncbi:phage tail spike protein [Clostridium butyricum]|uniref:phage tail spike protein n=1 Tax=Clostridium butyricum TaxID=1492 RepID=UPI002AB1D603|nr:phage tail spike protein [Clostridium butyricum]